VADEHAPDPLDAFALLDDEYARSILAALSHDPMTATTLSDHCAMSLTTVYRRLETPETCGFVTSRTVVDEDIHHWERYGIEFADTFTDLWEEL
jgi:predicted transcriptional regulator